MNARKVTEWWITCRKTVIFNSLSSMGFPRLYNEVAHVSTEPTTVPTAAVLPNVLHSPTDVSIAVCTCLLQRTTYTYWCIYCCTYVPTVPTTLPTVRTRILPTTVQYVLRTATRTSCTADVGTFTYWQKGYCCRVDRYLPRLHSVSTYCTYWCTTACTYCWCTYIYWRKKLPAAASTYLLLYVRTYCTYLVLGTYWCT